MTSLLAGALLGLCGCAAPESQVCAPIVTPRHTAARLADPAPISLPRVDFEPVVSRADSALLVVTLVEPTGPLLAVADTRFVGARCLAVEVSHRAGLARSVPTPGPVLARAD